jgi:hypothetical protein
VWTDGSRDVNKSTSNERLCVSFEKLQRQEQKSEHFHRSLNRSRNRAVDVLIVDEAWEVIAYRPGLSLDAPPRLVVDLERK